MADIKSNEDFTFYESLQEHKDLVSECFSDLIKIIKKRSENHDKSKLEAPEFEMFSKWTPILSKLTYGSDDYKKSLENLKPALDHHYASNRHHPEHFKNGIQDMNLVDVIEMFIDWYCSSKRQHNGNIRHSIEFNKSRFGFSDDVTNISINTIELFDR